MSKVDELRAKLNGTVESLKKKFSKSSKKKGEEEDFDEEEYDEDEFDEDTGQVEIDPSDMGEDIDAEDSTATDIDVPSDDEEDDEEEDEQEDEEDEDEKKQKQKKLIIQGGLVLVILYLGYDVMMADKNDGLEKNTLQITETKKKPKKKRKKQRRDRKSKPEAKEVAQKVEEKKPVPIEEPKTVKEVAKQPENGIEPNKQEVNPSPIKSQEPIAEKSMIKEEKIVEPVVKREETKRAPRPVSNQTPSQGREEPSVAQNNSMKNNDASAIPPETPAEPMNSKIGENTLEFKDDSSSLAMDQKVDEILEKSQKAKQEKNNPKKEEMSEVPDSYVEPPTYKRLGRGLVYNCVGKHWACVDKFSYFQCRENKKWSISQDKKPECVTKNVYASEKDCGIVQLHYINTREPTDFCAGVSNEKDGESSTKVMVP